MCLSEDNSITSKLNFELNAYNLYFYIEWLRLILLVYVKSFFSILGLLTNFLIMIVIMNKKYAKNFNNCMYNHIFFNAMFNFAYSLIQSFSLVNICIFHPSSFFSSIYKTYESQYFKIIQESNFFDELSE